MASYIEYKRFSNSVKHEVAMKTIENQENALESLSQVFAKLTPAVVDAVDTSATQTAQKIYEEEFQKEIQEMIDSGAFDVDKEGNPFTNPEDIYRNVEEFSKNWLENYDGNWLVKRKLEKVIGNSNEVFGLESVKTMMNKNSEYRNSMAEEYGTNTLNSTIPNVSAFNEITICMKDYNDMSDQQKAWLDSGTEWGAKSLRYDIYLEGAGYTAEQRAYIMKQFEGNAKRTEWINNINTSYSNNVLTGLMSESQFQEALDKDLRSEAACNLLGISPDDENAHMAYENLALSNVAKLRQAQVAENDQKFNDNFDTIMRGIADSGTVVTPDVLSSVMSQMEINPDFLGSATSRVYQGWSEYANRMQWATDYDTVLKELATYSDLPEEERRAKYFQLLSSQTNKDVQLTMGRYENLWVESPQGTVTLAQLELSQILSSNPFTSSYTLSSLDNYTIETIEPTALEQTFSVAIPNVEDAYSVGLEELALINAGLDEYNDSGVITTLSQSELFKSMKQANPNMSDIELVSTITTAYNRTDMELSSDQRRYISAQADNIKNTSRDIASSVMQNVDNLDQLLWLYAFDSNALGDQAPLVLERLVNQAMNTPDGATLRAEWGRTVIEAGEKVWEKSDLDFGQSEQFKTWYDNNIKPLVDSVRANWNTAIDIDGTTVGDAYGDVVITELWRQANERSRDGLVTENAPDSALRAAENRYNELCGMIIDAFAEENYSIVGAEIQLAFSDNIITRAQYDELNNMLAKAQTPRLKDLGINVRQIVRDNMDGNIDETGFYFNRVLSMVAQDVSNIQPTDYNTAMRMVGDSAKSAINQVWEEIAAGDKYDKLEKNEISNWKTFWSVTKNASPYIKYESPDSSFYPKSLEFLLTSSTNSKTAEQLNRVITDKELSNEEMAAALLASSLGMSWTTETLQNSDFRDALATRFNDLDLGTKTAILGTVNYGVERYKVAGYLRDAGYDYETISKDGTTFYLKDGQAFSVEADSKGNITYITYKMSDGNEYRFANDDLINDSFKTFFKQYVKDTNQTRAFKYAHSNKTNPVIEEAFSVFCQSNENVQNKIAAGFTPSLDLDSIELKDSLAFGWVEYSFPTNLVINWSR